MTYEMELYQVNDIKSQLARLARSIVQALQDHKVTPLEGMLLGNRGLLFAMTMVTMLESLPPEQLEGVLYVLEHGEITLPPASPLQQRAFPEVPLHPGPGA